MLAPSPNLLLSPCRSFQHPLARQLSLVAGLLSRKPSKGMPDSTLDVFVASIAPSTQNRYGSPLKLWLIYCRNHNIDLYKPTVSEVVNFLSKTFEVGASYGSLNSIRAALSLIVSEDISKNKEISHFF